MRSIFIVYSCIFYLNCSISSYPWFLPFFHTLILLHQEGKKKERIGEEINKHEWNLIIFHPSFFKDALEWVALQMALISLASHNNGFLPNQHRYHYQCWLIKYCIKHWGTNVCKSVSFSKTCLKSYFHQAKGKGPGEFTRATINIKDRLSQVRGFSMLKIRWSWDRLIFNMGILILVRSIYPSISILD